MNRIVFRLTVGYGVSAGKCYFRGIIWLPVNLATLSTKNDGTKKNLDTFEMGDQHRSGR